jgi:hypothetical protein
VKALSTLSVAVLLGFGAATFGSVTAQAANEPACDDVGALTAYITAAVIGSPEKASEIAGQQTARCPADAAAIATAAVNADPNGAQGIVDAVIAALPPGDRDNDVLTGAITQLYGFQGPNPPGHGGVGAPLFTNWTDPPATSPR